MGQTMRFCSSTAAFAPNWCVVFAGDAGMLDYSYSGSSKLNSTYNTLNVAKIVFKLFILYEWSNYSEINFVA